MIDKEDILKKLTSEDIIGIVEKYGGEKCSEDDEKIIFTTICHNSNSHKLYYYKNSGNFQCYTACGMIGNIFNFLIHINMYKFEDAIREVCDYKGIDAYSKKHRSFRNRKCNNEDLGFLKIHNYKVENKEYLLPIYDEQVLNCFEYDKIEKSWEEEGITDEVMDYFEIGFYSPDVCHTIPHRSYKDGSLCGIRRRTFLKELLDKKMKCMPIEINNIVYLLNKKGYSAIAYNGELSQKKRQDNIDKFEQEVQFLVANKTCAGYGLNLQFCSYIIFYSNDYDFGTRAQAEDRVHRIGQNKNVHIIDNQKLYFRYIHGFSHWLLYL